jgi:hypothetical protein
MSDAPSRGELILYRTEDGREAIRLRVVDGTVWLTQAEIAALLDTTPQNVSLHLKNVFETSELLRDSVVRESLTTAAGGKALALDTASVASVENGRLRTCKDHLQFQTQAPRYCRHDRAEAGA